MTTIIEAISESEIGTNRAPNRVTETGSRFVPALGDEYGRQRVRLKSTQLSSPLVYVQTAAFTPTGLGYVYATNTDGKIAPIAGTTTATFTSAAATIANFKVGQTVVLSGSTTSQNGTDGNISYTGTTATLTSASLTYANTTVGQSIQITAGNTAQFVADAKITQTSTTSSLASATLDFTKINVGQKIVIDGINARTPQNGTDGVIVGRMGSGVKFTSTSITYASVKPGYTVVITGAAHSENNGTFIVQTVGTGYLILENGTYSSHNDTTLTWQITGNAGTWTVATTDNSTYLTYTNANGYTSINADITAQTKGNTGTYPILTKTAGTNITFSIPNGITESGSAITWAVLGNNGTYTVKSVNTTVSLTLQTSTSFTSDQAGNITYKAMGTSASDGKITVFGTPTNTFTSASLDYTKITTDMYIKITSSGSGGNIGTFKITAVNASNIQFRNASGVVDTAGTMAYSIVYAYKTATELFQSITASTTESYNTPYAVQFTSNNGGVFTFGTSDSNTYQQVTLLGGKDYNWALTKIYLPTTDSYIQNAITDLYILAGG